MKKLTLGVIASMLLFFTGVSSVSAFEGHVNMYEFDEGGGRLLADSIGYWTAELLGAGAGKVPGKIGDAVHFTGKTGEAMLLENNMILPGDGTVAFWFKLDALSDENVLVSSRAEMDRDVHMVLGVDQTGHLFVNMRQLGSTTDTIVKTTQAIGANQWHQLIFTVATGTYAFYVDGVKWTLDKPAHHGVWFSQIAYGVLEYRLGASVAAGTGGVLRGAIDDFCFFNHGFTDAEAQFIFKGNADYIANISKFVPAFDISLKAEPDKVAYMGETKVTFDAPNALGCIFFGKSSGGITKSDSLTFKGLTEDTLYSVSCWNEVGSKKKFTSVLVGKPGQGVAQIKEDIKPLQKYIELVTPPTPPPSLEPEPVTFIPEPSPVAPPPPPPPQTVNLLPPPTSTVKGTPNLDLPTGCTEYIHTFMKKGQKNDVSDVKRLQTFLNETISAGLPVSGFFGTLTHKAVQRFQVKYHKEIIQPWLDVGYKASDITNGTGYVYKTTKFQINIMKCATLNTPRPVLLDDLN